MSIDPSGFLYIPQSLRIPTSTSAVFGALVPILGSQIRFLFSQICSLTGSNSTYDQPVTGVDYPIQRTLENVFGISADVTGHEQAPGDAETVFMTIKATALRMGGKAATLVGGTAVSAFRSLFGKSTIVIYLGEDDLSILSGRVTGLVGTEYGFNCGFEKCADIVPANSPMYPSPGSYMIFLAGNRVLRNGSSEGINLVAHEISHNLTWQSYDYDVYAQKDGKHPFVYQGQYFGPDAGIGVTAGNHPSNDPDAEDTADVIASWALNFYTAGQEQNAARDTHIAQFMTACLFPQNGHERGCP